MLFLANKTSLIYLCVFFQGEIHTYDSYYECQSCAPGCETCEDGSPCILTLDWIQRSVVLALSCLVVCFIPGLLWFTYRHQDVKVRSHYQQT